MKIPEHKVTQIADFIATQVIDMHAGYLPKVWNPQCGRWLVYGFETYFGLPRSAQLCQIVEVAWRNKTPIIPLIEEFLREQD